MATEKSREEIWHGSKFGFIVIALVILIVISLLGSIVFLIGEGIKSIDVGIDAGTFFFWALLIVGLIVLLVIIALIFVKAGLIAMSALTHFFSHIFGFFTWIGSIFSSLFSNIYILVVAIIVIIILVFAVAMAVTGNVSVDLTNPVTVVVLIVLLILFFPFAIFLIDLFSLEHE